MYTTPTTRRSIRRSPTSSPSSPTLDPPPRPQQGDESPSAKPGRGPGYSSLLTSPDASLKTPGFGPDRDQPGMGMGMGMGRGMNMRSIQARESLAGPDLSPSRHVVSGSDREKTDEEEEAEAEAVDGLIDKMQRNMRIVSSSSSSSSGRPRLSEVEVDMSSGGVDEEEEVGGEEDGEFLGQRNAEQLEGGRATSRSKVVLPRSLRQPAIQPRMNKSTLARLDPNHTLSNATLGGRTGTRGKEVSTSARRPLSVAAPLGGPAGEKGVITPKKVLLTGDAPGGGKRKSMVLTPTSLRPPAITPRGTRSSDLRKTVIDNPSYLSPSVDKLSVSRLSGLTVEEVKKREAVIFQGTPGHRRGLSLKEKEGLWSLRPSTPHRTNRSADLRRDPTLADRPVTPMREFKARPLPAMYGAGAGGGTRVTRMRDEGGADSPRAERQAMMVAQESRPRVRG